MVSLADLIKGFISVKDICIILDLTVLCTVLYIYSCEIQPGSNILEFISWMTKKLSQKIHPATQCPKKSKRLYSFGLIFQTCNLGPFFGKM